MGRDSKGGVVFLIYQRYPHCVLARLPRVVVGACTRRQGRLGVVTRQRLASWIQIHRTPVIGSCMDGVGQKASFTLHYSTM